MFSRKKMAAKVADRGEVSVAPAVEDCYRLLRAAPGYHLRRRHNTPHRPQLQLHLLLLTQSGVNLTLPGYYLYYVIYWKQFSRIWLL